MSPVAWRKHLIGDLSLKRAVLSLSGIYAFLSAYLYFSMDGMVFLPQPATYTDGPGLFKLQTADGLGVTASHLVNPKARYTLLYSHGNAEDLGENLPTMARLRDLGFSVLIYDYPGYGTSAGQPTEASAQQAIEAAYQHLVNVRHVPPARLIAYGRSVGGAPTTYLASRFPVAGLVLESTFTDPASVRVPWRILPFVKFDSLGRLKALSLPVLVLHGLDDDLIPASHGQALYQAARGPKAHLWVPGAGHDDLKEVAGATYDKALVAFAASLQQGGPSTPR